jgi:transposase
MKLKRETGSPAPGKVGGHKKRTLSGESAVWLRERCRSGPFTTRGLTAELAARGIKSGRLVDTFTPSECANYFAAAGYDPT